MCIIGMWSDMISRDMKRVGRIKAKDFDRVMADCDSKRQASAVIKRRLAEARKGIAK